MDKQYISRTLAAAAAAALLLAAPLAVSAQTTASQAPSQDQVNAIASLNNQYFDDVHFSKATKFAAITTPNFQVTYPNGAKIDGGQLIERAATRNLEESGYQRTIAVHSMTTDGSTITEDVTTKDISDLLGGDTAPQTQTQSSNRTLTWVQGADGKWLLASERINKIEQSPYSIPSNG
jgi:ketosteroid isomerase-like protein